MSNIEYTAYLSYAYADDEACSGWVGQFAEQLRLGLTARLPGLDLPPLYFSGKSAPASGVLGGEIRSCLATSFVLIILVYDSYAQSPWCLKELETFHEFFGDEGLRQRLYIVVLSEPALMRAQSTEAWRRLLPADQVWLPFFNDHDRDRPLEIYLSPSLVAPEFHRRFNPLSNDLAVKLRLAKLPPRGARPVAGLKHEVEIGFFIGSDLARVDPETVAHLEAMGMRPIFISQVDIAAGKASLARAKHLVLPFDNKPLASRNRGGNLALMHKAWLDLGRTTSSISWLDLRSTDERTRPGGAALWVQQEGFPTVTAKQLIDELSRVAIAAAPRPDNPQRPLRISIESNPRERSHWEAIAALLEARLPAVLAGAQGPGLRCRDLPIEQIDEILTLDDTDGLILLWGKKSGEALMAQINRVENKLSYGREPPPGIVAYLMPPQFSAEPVPALGWRVLRFEVSESREIATVDKEQDELDSFLRLALEHWRRAGDESHASAAALQ